MRLAEPVLCMMLLHIFVLLHYMLHDTCYVRCYIRCYIADYLTSTASESEVQTWRVQEHHHGQILEGHAAASPIGPELHQNQEYCQNKAANKRLSPLIFIPLVVVVLLVQVLRDPIKSIAIFCPKLSLRMIFSSIQDQSQMYLQQYQFIESPNAFIQLSVCLVLQTE